MSALEATGLLAIERAFTRMCFDRVPSEADLGALHADRERWLMYRRMVRSRLFQMARMGLPKSSELIGKERFDDAVAGYLEARGPRSRFIRDVVHELVEHALPTWAADPELPAHVSDLVRLEATRWRVSALEDDRPAVGELDFEAPAVINPTARAIDVRHRVDKDPKDPLPLSERHLVIVYRAEGSAKVRVYVLNDIGARLYLAWCRPDKTCADGARDVLAVLERQPDATFIDGMAEVLSTLVTHGVILGSPLPT